jgi:hypothetical protein
MRRSFSTAWPVRQLLRRASEKGSLQDVPPPTANTCFLPRSVLNERLNTEVASVTLRESPPTLLNGFLQNIRWVPQLHMIHIHPV